MNNYSFDEFSRQSPKGIVINYFVLLYKVVKSMWVLIPVLFSGSIQDKMEFIWIVLIVLSLVLLLIAILQYWHFRFKIEDDHFIIEQGVFFKKKTSIPLDRIQSVNFKQNIIHQIIQVTQVDIQTAGAKDAEVSIKAISREKADELKRRLQSYSGNKIVETENEEEKPSYLFHLSFFDLLKVSFSENHVRSFFWILAVVFSLIYQAEDVIKNLDFSREIARFVRDNGNEITGSVILMSVVLVVVVLISVVVSFVRVILKHFDQRVVKINDGIQISQGLFTKRVDVLKISKVQYIVKVTNPVKKRMGIQTIKIKQAGNAKMKQKKLIELVGVKNEFLIPLRTMLFGPILSDSENQIKPSPYYIYQMAVRTTLLLCLINFCLWLNITNSTFLIYNIILVPLSIILIGLKYKKTYFNLIDSKLIVGDGKIGTRTSFMEYYKAQNVKLVQSFIQNRRGVATLKLQTASGVIKLPCLRESDARFIQDIIIKETETNKKPWI